MKKIMGIGGRPGTGKTTLMRKFIERHKWEIAKPKKLLPTMYCEKLDLHILGVYEEGELFAGTDRLSMAVQPEAIEFVSETNSNVLFEGDRLFTQSFLEHLVELPDTEVEVLVLTADENTLNSRYQERGSDQSEQFLRSRRTKVDKICSNFDLAGHLEICENLNQNTMDQLIYNMELFYDV